jgi:hypothetical protein
MAQIGLPFLVKVAQPVQRRKLVFAQALKNAAYVSLTLGGQRFAGHGVWTTSGNDQQH